MGTIDDILIIRKALDNLLDTPQDIPDKAGVHIKDLSNMKMTMKLLQKTKIGFTLDKLRKSTDNEVVKKSAKNLIKQWQKLDEKDNTKEPKKKSSVSATDRLIPLDFDLTASEPVRNKRGQLVFEDHPEFVPNLSPKEVLQLGSFGGTYFRPIYSSVTKQKYGKEVWQELPTDWLTGLDIRTRVSSSVYDASRNKYKVKCGASLEEWENSGWMHAQDPYGWFQWYCRFYQGRRTQDDERQISRWSKCAGEKGRWKNNLISKIVKAGCAWDNMNISPVVRQTLQHWGYQLTQEDFNKNSKKFK